VARAESVVVTVDPDAASPEFGPDFIGLSYEMPALLSDQHGRHFFVCGWIQVVFRLPCPPANMKVWYYSGRPKLTFRKA